MLNLSRLKKFCTWICVLSAWSLWLQEAKASSLIYEAFEEPFAAIEQNLFLLKQQGFTHILISPPQKSLDRPEWWARYQPLDYRSIEGPLGDARALAALCNSATAAGLVIIADTVLNHMADVRHYPELSYPQFSAGDFHRPQSCIEDFSDRKQAVQGWLCDERAILPDLKTESAQVRSIQLTYLKLLVELGVRGFRFDAAVNIESDYFRALRQELPSNLFYFGEVVGTSLNETRLYADDMLLTDFWLLRAMLPIFYPAHSLAELGELMRLQSPIGGEQIAFTRTHDGLFHHDFFNFDSDDSLSLAYSFILTAGFPNAYVLNQDLARPEVQAALKFRQATRNQSARLLQSYEICRDCLPSLVAWTRGAAGWVLINNASQWQKLSNTKLDLPALSCYRELRYGFRMCLDADQHIKQWADSGVASVGPRTALFFLRD